MFRSLSGGAALACALTLTCAGAAFAEKGGAGTETTTEHGHGTPVFSEAATNPCNGEAGTIAAVSTNEVFHVTSQADGDFWLTGTAEGIITFTPDEAEGVSASGHFAVWFGAAKNNRNELEHNTFNAHMTASDGSHIAIHMDAHTSTNALGEVKVSFENMRMTCAG